MLKDIKDSPLYYIANPRSLAVFGASNNIGGMGTNLLNSLMSIGFSGSIYPIHPTETTVLGLKAYQSVGDLPVVPDLALLVIPNRLVNQTLIECGQKGLKRAIVVSGGFKEVGGSGVEMEKELKDICQRYGIRLMGPNGLGVANPHHPINTTFLPYEGPAGYIGLASQSGSFVTQMFNYLNIFNLGFSTAFSVGNEADVDMTDCLEYLGACPRTKVIALYIEGLKRGRDFVEMARSITPHKPIVALYVGGSETGRRAGFSHTGSLAGPDRLYDGIFRQAGILRAGSITELFDICWALGSLPLPAGPRVIIQTHSGGPGAAAADACGRADLVLPPLSRQTMDKLAQFVPHTSSLQNPVDLTFSKNPHDFYSVIPQVLIEEEQADIILIYLFTPSAIIQRTLKHLGATPEQAEVEGIKLMQNFSRQTLSLREKTTKPILGYTWRGLDEIFVKEIISHGMPVFPDPTRAARALRAMLTYKTLKEKIMAGRQ